MYVLTGSMVRMNRVDTYLENSKYSFPIHKVIQYSVDETSG